MYALKHSELCPPLPVSAPHLLRHRPKWLCSQLLLLSGCPAAAAAAAADLDPAPAPVQDTCSLDTHPQDLRGHGRGANNNMKRMVILQP
jgi:hypothetical protein